MVLAETLQPAGEQQGRIPTVQNTINDNQQQLPLILHEILPTFECLDGVENLIVCAMMFLPFSGIHSGVHIWEAEASGASTAAAYCKFLDSLMVSVGFSRSLFSDQICFLVYPIGEEV